MKFCLREIRKILKYYIVALPIKYKKTKDQPTFINLDNNNE